MNQETNNWETRLLVKSSLIPKKTHTALFIGRWQPLHDGHIALFKQALNAGKKVLIAVRDCEPDEKNPFTAVEVSDMIWLKFGFKEPAGKVNVIIIPDIDSVEFGRGVGYDIIEHVPPAQIAQISGTKIREQMRNEGEL